MAGFKRGYIYFIYDKKSNAIKIGYSEDPQKRLKELQTACPNRLQLIYMKPGDKRDEQIYHETYKDLRKSGEWFKAKDKLKDFVEGRLDRPYVDNKSFESQELNDLFMKMGDGDYRILFGKHYNGTLKHLIKYERGYVDWIIWKSDFPEHVKEFVADCVWKYDQDNIGGKS